MVVNQTNIEHVVIALLHQFAVGLLFGNWWAGAALGAGIYIGREFAQAERRVLFALGLPTLTAAHERGYYPELLVFRLKYWDVDSLLDVLLPSAAVLSIALVLS